MNQNFLKRVTVKKEDIFTYYHFPCNILPLFGWKIHVSVIPQNYLKIRRIVKQYCISQQINFKFVTKKKNLLNSFAKFANPLFTGKYITIYPKDNHQAKTTLKKLYLQLKGEEGPRILTDKTYRNSIIQYRYGALLSSSTLTKKQKTDIREMGYYKPPGIEELFKNSKVKKKKINRYTPITVLKHNNFGGINVVTKNSEIFILKWSRNLMWYSKELNQIELRKQEIKLIRQTKKDFFPKFIESFNDQKIFFSVFEYKKGINLMDLAQMIHMQIVRANGKVEEKIENFLLLLIKNMIQLLDYTREKSLILNDIKLSNFICCSDEKIVFIDLEHSFLPNSKYKPQIYNVLGKKESCPTWESDVRKVGLMLINVISGSWPLENKFSSKEIIANHFKDFCKTFKVKDIITKNVLSFLNFKKGDNLSIKQTKLKPFEEIKTLAPEIKIKLMNTEFWDYEIREGIKSLKKIKIFWKKIIKLLNEKKNRKNCRTYKRFNKQKFSPKWKLYALLRQGGK